jgi:hypothetical protein
MDREDPTTTRQSGIGLLDLFLAIEEDPHFATTPFALKKIRRQNWDKKSGSPERTANFRLPLATERNGTAILEKLDRYTPELLL